MESSAKRRLKDIRCTCYTRRRIVKISPFLIEFDLIFSIAILLRLAGSRPNYLTQHMLKFRLLSFIYLQSDDSSVSTLNEISLLKLQLP